MSIDFAERARALVGTPFRLQGRGVGGLDCVGLTAATFDVPVEDLPSNYRLRGDYLGDVRDGVRKYFCRIAPARIRPGDLMVMRVSDDQIHLGVRTELGFVHAHAGLRRVVETPGAPEWPILGVYRRRSR